MTRINNTYVLGGIVVVVVAVSAFLWMNSTKTCNGQCELSEEDAALLTGYKENVEAGSVITGTDGAGAYEAYSPNKLSRAKEGRVVIFFHATWCPTCRTLHDDIEKNASLIPKGITILKTDYDRETALKRKYGVTTQHTLVEVDAEGNLIQKWSGGTTLATILALLK